MMIDLYWIPAPRSSSRASFAGMQFKIMRIGIDVRALMEGKVTGVQVYITNLLESLFEIDRENEYILFANQFTTSPPAPLLARRGRGIENVSTKFFRYPNKLFIPAQKFVGLPKIDKLLGGIDLFFSPHWRETALSPNIPLVVTFHHLSFEIVPEFFTLRLRAWHKFMNYRGAAKKAAKIIAVSENTKRDLVDLYKIAAEKIEVIYPGLKPPLNLPLSAQGGQGEKERGYFLYFGTFEPRKNIDTVLTAYEEYCQESANPKNLVLAGSSGWKVRLEIPLMIKGRVKIFENVSEEQKALLYQNAFAFLFLSFYEGLGFPILEAASWGIPVISSFATSLSEIGHEFAILVNPFRSSQTASAMLELEKDEGLYKSLQEKGLEAVRGFTWEKTARRILELFYKVKSP